MFDMQIEVVGKSAGVATQLQGTIVELTEVSIVKLSLHPRDVSSTSQIGKDLVVKLVNGESITIKNFFITEGDDKSELVLEDDEGALWYAQYDYPLTEMVFVEASDSVVLGWAEWGLGALALLGLAVGASGGGSSSKGNFSVDKTPPDAPTDLEINNNEDGSTTVTGKGESGAEVIITDEEGNEVGRGEVDEEGNFEVEVENGLKDGEEYDVIVKDPAGNESEAGKVVGDTTAPDAPTDLEINNNEDGSTTVTGKGEPGAEIIITDKDDKEVGRGEVDGNGDFEIEVEGGLKDGEEYEVVAEDKAGNQSEPETIVGDQTRPDAPTDLEINNNEDGSTTVTGKGEPGAEIIITDKDDKEVGRGEVDGNGDFEIEVEGGLKDGEEYEVVAEDKAGNQSEPETIVGDQTRPDAPTDLEINNNEDGSTTVTGKGEPGAEIIITDKDDKEVGRGEVDGNGDFEIEVEGGLKDGEEYEVVAEDKAGNQSEPETIVGDQTRPDAPTDLEINNNEDGSTTVTGKGEPGAEIIITDKDDKEVGRGEVDGNGDFEIEVEGGLKDGEEYEVVAEDKAGNQSEPETIVGDQTRPDAPTDLEINNNEDGSTTVTGKGEPGAEIIITDKDDKEVGRGEVDGNGDFEIEVEGGLKDGEEYEVVAEDKAGNQSEPETIVGDQTRPDAPTDLEINNNEDGSTTVTGKGEPGAEIIITDKDDKEVGRGEVDGNGDFEIEVEGGLKDGEEYEVVAEDKAGNQSEPETIVGDQTRPDAPTDLEINNNEDGSTTVTGKGEPGAEIIITDKDDKEVGRGEVDGNGDFEIEVEGGLKDGEEYEVVAEDKAGNQSEPETIVGDQTRPDAPTDLEINNNEDGSTTVTGKGEPGAEIIITDKDDKEVGRGEVDGNGDFEIEVEGGLKDGEEYEVVAEDKAGNQSEPETIVGDQTPPDPPTDLEINNNNEDGSTTVTGKGEPGAEIIITDKDDKEVGRGEVDGNGDFEIKVEDGLKDGEEYDVVAKDPAGNVSDKETITGDTTAPDDTTTQVEIDSIAGDDVINAEEAKDTVTISGTVTGEFTEGDTVTLKVADGTEHTGIVDAEGRFAVEIDGSALVSTGEGEQTVTVTVTATDAAGNQGDIAASKDYTVDTQPPSIENVESYNVDTDSPANGEANKTVVTFKGEPGVSYKVTIGDTTKTSTGDAEGNHTVSFLPPANEGADVTITGTDTAGNSISETTQVSDGLRFDDTTAPDDTTTQVEIDSIAGDDVINAEEAKDTVTISGTVTGEFTEGDTVTLKVADGTEHTGIVDAEGRFAVEIDGSALVSTGEGEQSVTVTVTATDAAGNQGDIAASKDYTVDTQPPSIENVESYNVDTDSPANGEANKTVVTFKGEPGASYTVTIGDTTIKSSGDVEGNHKVTFLPPADMGAEVIIIGTDIAGNTISATEAVADELRFDDTSAPDDSSTSVTVDPITADNVLNKAESETQVTVSGTVKGVFTAGDTITITLGDNVIGTGNVDADGRFSVTVEGADLVAAEQVKVTVEASSAAGVKGEITSEHSYTVDVDAPEVSQVATITLDKSPANGDADITIVSFRGDDAEATYTVVIGNTTVIATGPDADGFYVAEFPPQAAGQEVVITATDTAGNSATATDVTPTEITSGDTEVPQQPEITSVTNSFDEQGALTGTVIKGKTDGGALVQLYDAQGTLISEVKANINGNFEFGGTVLANGEDYTVSAKYELGNSSPAVTVVGDTEAPNVDTVKIVQLDTSDPADGAANQTLLTFNTDEPDADFTFSYLDQDGKVKEYTGKVEYSAQGNTVSATFVPPLDAGDKIIITGTDSYGNSGNFTTTEVPVEVTAVGDNTPPELTDVSLDETTDADGELTSHSFSFTTNDPTATYSVTVNGVKHTGEPVVTGEEGSQTYTYTFTPPLKAGDKVNVEATDTAGNTSSASATAEIFLNITEVEQVDTDSPADGEANKTIVKFVANNKEPQTFSVKDANGKKIDVTVTRLNKSAGEDEETAPWQYEVTFDPALAAGAKVTIVGKLEGLDDVSKEATTPNEITRFEDADAPNAPVVDGFTNNKDDNSTTVTGTAEAGSTVDIIDPDTDAVIGSGIAGDDGKFEIVVEGGLTNGQDYNVTATDKADNTSEPTTVTGDTTAPEKLADDAIKIGNDGDAFINATEINNGKVKVVIELPKDTEGNVSTEAGDILVVNGVDYVITADDVTAGKVEFELDAPKEGEQLTVDAFLKDEHNNASEKVDASAKVDTEAPAKPVIDSVTEGEDGEVKGHTEPGATITDTAGNPLKDADDNDIVADADGNFTIPSGRVPENGIIKAKDDAGNQSEPVNVLKLPGIEQGFDNVASVDESGVATEYDTSAEHDQFSNNGFTNDATPYFEIPAGQAANANKNVLIITDADGNQTVVNAQVKDLGDGKTYLEITDKLVDGKYQVQYTTDADAKPADGADPQVLPSQGNELSESLTFTVDTQSPDKPVIDDVQNTFDDAGVLTGTTISGKVQGDGAAEVGATVEVKDADGQVVGTGVTDQNGNFTINIAPALKDGDSYTVEATDKAGNTSTASDTITGDTTAPAELAEGAIKIGDDDNAEYINAKEVTEGKFNVTVTLPAGIEVDDILVINGEEIKITQAHLDAKKVEHQLSTDDYAEGEKITVEAVIKDAFGNSNAGISADAVLDTQAPEVEFKQVNPTEFTLKVSEAGTVVLTDAEGNELKTIEVTDEQAGTDLTVTFDKEFDPNTQIKISATDKAGNVTNTQISVENIRTEASDNTEELVLDIVATQREATEAESIVGKKVTSFGVVSAGLGGVADAGVLDFANNAIELNVAEGTERKLELFADGGGVSIGDTYDLIIYKEDAYGNIKFYDVYDSWFTVPFLGMTKNGEITITEPGTYQIMLSSKAGVKVIGGAGLEVTKDTVVDYNNYQSVSGVKKGNVITDLDVSGKDQVDAPDDTRITKITYKDDKGTHEVDVPAVGSTVIQLTHGTLTVSAKGNYTYKLNEDANPQFGEKEEITYTLTNSNTGDSSSADLTINLVDKPSNLVPDSTVLLDMKPEAIAKDISEKDQLTSKTWADIASVGLGIADIGLIAIENGMDINVGANEVRDVTFYGTGGAPVSLGYSPVDLVIYKKETTANGDFWQLYTIEKNWFGIVGAVVGAGASSEDKTFRFDEGEYKAVLIPTTGGVSVIPSVTLRVREDKLYEYKQTNTKVDANLDLEEGAKVYSVNGDPLGEGDNIIQGQYGTLTIKADGSYSYKLYQNIAYKDIGNMETFSYSILGADNKLYNSTLNIVINNVQANDDFGDARFGLDNQEAYEGWAVSGTKTGGSNTTYSPELIEVKANQVYDLTLNYNLNPTTARVDEFVIRLINDATGEVVKVYKPDVTGEKGELSWSLTEGQYRVEVIIDPRLANTVKYNLNLQGTITTLDKFQAEQTNTIVEEGSLLDNDTYKEGSGIAELAHIEVNGKPLDIVVNGQFDNNLYKSITIEGEHGTLVVQQDGSYTYTAHGDSYGVDVFDYKLISIAGSSDSAELTFNVGMNATGSKYDDKISSTAGNDTFEGGFGSDIFNFDLLDIDDATGGNGVDTWTDFHFGEVGTDADADVIDISALLPEGSENIDLDGLKDFLQVEFNEEEESITVSIDRDGKGSRFEFEELLVLTNQDEEKTLDDLFNNNQIIY